MKGGIQQLRRTVNILGAFFLFLVLVTLPGMARLSFAEPTESQIKAAFVYNFIKFVEWPQQSFPLVGSPIYVCLYGHDNLADALDSLAGRSAQGRKIVVKHISNPGEVERCNALYVAKSEKEQIVSILKAVKNNVLTVSDMKNFAAAGGTVNFIFAESRITFEINVDAADRAGLRISSQLLKLARIVRENGRKEEK